MGLSASQARLIALTARMNDIEYEAQQINQQRQVMTNKMNEVQQISINMDVPTPPSKQDFLYDVYKGKDKAGKTVSVTPNADGSFNVIQQKHGSVISKGDTLETTEGSVSSAGGVSGGKSTRSRSLGDADLFDAADKGREMHVKVKDLKPESKVCTDQNVLAALAGKQLEGRTTSAGNWKLGSVPQSSISCKTVKYFQEGNSKLTEKEVDDGNGGKKVVKASDDDAAKYGTVIEEYKDFVCETPIHTGDLVLDDNDYINVTVYPDGSLDPGSYSGAGAISAGYNLSASVADISNQKCYTESGKEYSVPKMKDIARNAINETGVKNCIGFYLKDENGTPLTEDDLFANKETYELNSNLVIWYPPENTGGVSPDGKTVNGRTVLTVTEADAKYGNDASTNWGNAKSALEHSYGKNYDDWRVVVDTSGTAIKFSFCKASDLSNGKVQMYEVGTGDFDDEPINVSADTIAFDESGHPESMTLPDGTTVTLTYSQEVDEIQYDKAMNQYYIKKAEYDKEQNELNKKTSIYQRQDKQLELKLTRLDNERNALNTEIEAVKKVIQDSIDRGFKTFST